MSQIIEELRVLQVTGGVPSTAFEWFPFLVAVQASGCPVAFDYIHDIGFNYGSWANYSRLLREELWANRGKKISEETV